MPGGFWWEAKLVIVTHGHLQFGMEHTRGRAVARGWAGAWCGLSLPLSYPELLGHPSGGVLVGMKRLDVGGGSQRTPLQRFLLDLEMAGIARAKTMFISIPHIPGGFYQIRVRLCCRVLSSSEILLDNPYVK